MILVSFSSGEDPLYHDVKIYHTVSSQGTENPPFRFFGTPGINTTISDYNKSNFMQIIILGLKLK